MTTYLIRIPQNSQGHEKEKSETPLQPRSLGGHETQRPGVKSADQRALERIVTQPVGGAQRSASASVSPSAETLL